MQRPNATDARPSHLRHKTLKVKCRIIARFSVAIPVIHRHSQEQRMLSVIGAGEPPSLFVRWPLGGERVLNLLGNRLELAPEWYAADIEGAWHIWNLIVAPDRRERGRFEREGNIAVVQGMKGKKE